MRDSSLTNWWLFLLFAYGEFVWQDARAQETQDSTLRYPLSIVILIPHTQDLSLGFQRVVANPIQLESAAAQAHALHLLHRETRLELAEFAADSARVVEFINRAERIVDDEIRSDVREQLGVPDMAKMSSGDQNLSIAERWNQIAADMQKHMPESDQQQIVAAFQYGLVVNQGLETWLQSDVTRRLLGLDVYSRRDALARLQNGKQASLKKITKALEESRDTILEELNREQCEWLESLTSGGPQNFDVSRCQLVTAAKSIQGSPEQMSHRFTIPGGLKSNSFGNLQIYNGTPFDFTVKVSNWISILDGRFILYGNREDLLQEIRVIDKEYLKKTVGAIDLALALDRADLLKGVRFTDACQISLEMHRKKVWDIVSSRVDPVVLENFQKQMQKHEVLIYGVAGVLASNRFPSSFSLSQEQLTQARATITVEADRLEKVAQEIQIELLENVARGFNPPQKKAWDAVFSDGIIRRNPMPEFLLE